MLPRPGAAALIRHKGVQAADQQTLRAVRPQPRVDFIQAPAAGQHGEPVHHPLRQPLIPASALQRARAVAQHLCAATVVDEYQVQIGGEAQLLAAEAAVAEHAETRAAAWQPSVLRDQLALGQRGHRHHHRLGQRSQPARGGDRVGAAIVEGQPEPERGGGLELVDPFKLRLGLALLQRGQHAGELGGDVGALEWQLVDARIEHVVQQQRLRDHALGQKRAVAEHPRQPLARGRLLLQQGQIGRAPRHRLHQPRQPQQARYRRGADPRRGKQLRHQVIQPLARTRRHRPHRHRLRQLQQRLGQLAARHEAGGFQHGRVQRFIAGVLPQYAVGRRHAGRAAALRHQHGGELLADDGAMGGQRRGQRVPVGIVQAERDALAAERIVGDVVGLRVAQHLHAVLHLPQQHIGSAQHARARAVDMSARLARHQRRQQAAHAQAGFAATADQLGQLHDELDLADAAGAELEVVGQILARDFRIDQPLHFAQAGERGVVEVLAVHERPQQLLQLLAGMPVAGHRTRLDPGVALPVAPLALVVLLHRGERQRQPAGVAERAQAQVDAGADAVHGRLVQQAHQLAPEPDEILAVVEPARAVAVAALRIGQHQVDVGGEVQLAAAELAEADHQQPLQLALGIAAVAVTRGQRALGPAQRGAEQRLIQHAGGGQDLRQFIQPVDVAKHQPQRLGVAKTAQRLHAGRFVVRQLEGVDARAGVAAGAQPLQPLRRQQLRLAAPHLKREIAGQQGAPDALGHAGIVMQRHAGGAAAGNQVAVAVVDQRTQRGGFMGSHRRIVPHCARAVFTQHAARCTAAAPAR